jgi:S1-C subfamily serine protease
MTLTTASAPKSAGAKYGIAFSRKTPDAPLSIRTIREDSPFANKGLVPGMVVTKINGVAMTWLGPREAAKILQKAKIGTTMTVEAATAFVATGLKKKKKLKCGVWLKNSTTEPGVYISRINDDSIFKNSELEMGMKVVQINNKPCLDDFDFRRAIEMLKACQGDVEIVAIDSAHRYRRKDIKKSVRSIEIPGLEMVSSEEGSVGDPYTSRRARGQKSILDYIFPTLVDL